MAAPVKILTNVQIARELGAAIGGALVNSMANPTVVTTTVSHNLVTGDAVNITGSNSTPVINGNWIVTVLSSTTFSIPINVTGAGTAGVLKKLTKGTTPLAGDTWRRLVGNFKLSRIEDLEEFPDLDVGLYVRAQAPIVINKGVAFELTTPLDFTQLLWALQSGLKGGVTPTGGGADKTWTFTPSMSAGIIADTYTMEANETDGFTNAIIRANYMFCDEWEISANTEGVAQLRAHFMARAPADASAFTATTPGAVPALIYAPAIRGQAFLDATWAGLGTTPLGTGQLYGFSYKVSNAIFPQKYMDGRATLDFSREETRRIVVDLTLDVVSDPTATAFVQVEEAAKLAATMRFIRVKLLGPALGGSAYEVDVDLACTHASDSMVERFSDRDGNLVTKAHLTAQYDLTSTNSVQARVINAATAFP